MFKSVFAKYITTFILIIAISFCMLLSIIISLVDDHMLDTRSEIVESIAASTEAYLELKYEKSHFVDFEAFVQANQAEVADIILSLTSNWDGVSIILTDKNGKFLFYSSEKESSLMTKAIYLSSPTIDKLRQGERTIVLGPFSDSVDRPYVAYAIPLIDDSGAVQGSIVAAAVSNAYLQLFRDLSNTIFASILWVMVAVLIAVYFITEMITGPLREMSKAAKSFAKGLFNVRVPVRGKDEVAELATAFNNMAQSLENLENMRNTFMANVSHDLRTPMTTISGFIDNILVGAISPEEQPHYLGIIKEEVRRLSQLVSSLLDISRLQAGDRKFTMQHFDVCELARLILISFEQKIDDKKLNVDFDCDEERMYTNADRDAIYQVLYNICDNGIKFSQVGGDYRIRIRYDHPNKKLVVSVFNQGEGISQEDLPFVFERFYKADKSRGLDKHGVGLGMFISKTIIDAHQESIWVESTHGKCCEFFFTLPADSGDSIAK